MFKAKYIIADGMTPVAFPETLTHADVAFKLFGGKERITGAGFFHIDLDGWYRCYGESISLEVKSNGEADAKILNKFMGGPEADF